VRSLLAYPFIRLVDKLATHQESAPVGIGDFVHATDGQRRGVTVSPDSGHIRVASPTYLGFFDHEFIDQMAFLVRADSELAET
jgi:hypothetical protein